MMTSQMIASRTSAPKICEREKRITTLQKNLRQLRVRRAHQRTAFRFKHRHEPLSRQPVHGAQGTEIICHVALREFKLVLPEPCTRSLAQWAARNNI